MERIVLHVDMDAFFAAIEELDNPEIRGKPVVVGADPKGGRGRGVVSTANYEARKFGIQSATPISIAYQLCPDAVFLSVNMERYRKVSQRIMMIVSEFGKVFEQVSVDEAYLEMNREQRTKNREWEYENAKEVAREIKRRIWEKEKLTCSIGIGPNKLVAKIASGQQKPNGFTVVLPDEVQNFLDPKSADTLPGIGPKTYASLQKLGVKTVADLRRFSKDKLVSLFGKHGEWMWEAARGIDESPVEEYREVKSVGRQTTFEEDTDSSKQVIDTALALLSEVFEELREERLSGRTLTVIVRYRGFETHTSAKTEGKPLTEASARKLAMKLLLPFLGKRKIRLVGVRVSGFT
ncbi:DNA polymerase IV [Candidatus Roizmanbacteria bacterium]|nr:DNA polymerase IV [Candidatus Roizmanbacteria bacterium]